MYKVVMDGEVIHYARAGIELIDPVLELEENRSGSFQFGMDPKNPGYELPKKLKSRVEVWCDGEALYYGRVFDESVGIDRIKRVTCEGELSYLIDSIQRPREYHGVTVTELMQSLLKEHNSQTEESKHFELGSVTVRTPDGGMEFETDWENTLQSVQEKLAGKLGGYLIVRHEEGKRYLDYVEQYGRVNDQGIEFGRNLIDYSQTTSAENIATCIIPLGAKQETEESGEEKYLTIESVNGGKDYLENAAAVETYGRVMAAVHFDEEEDAEELKKKGEEYLRNTQYDTLNLTLTAFDLGHLDREIRKIRVGDEIRVYSKPHDVDRYFPVTRQTINLNNPEKDQIELGAKAARTLTERMVEGDKTVLAKVESLPSQSSTVKLAEEAARRFSAMAAATVGYYTTEEVQEDGSVILYSHDKPQLKDSRNIWKKTGLVVAVSNDGGKTWRGLDKDGNAILNDIAAKTITADRIKTGRLEGANNEYVYFDLDQGEIAASELSSSRYPNFTINVGPSERSHSYGAINAYDKSLGENGNIFSAYRVAVGSQNRPGAVWTAPYFTNVERTNRKGLAMTEKDIALFADNNGIANGFWAYTDGNVELRGNKISIFAPMDFKGHEPLNNVSSFRLMEGSNGVYLEIGNYTKYFGVDVWLSDKNMKKSIQSCDMSALEQVVKIPHHTFVLKDTGEEVKCGYVAQELEKINSEFVLKVDQPNGDKRYQIRAQAIIPVLTKAIQEMEKRLNKAEETIKSLKNRIVF